MKAVLLAGGFGTRLRPLTLNTPKPIVPIFDRPIVYHQIDLLKKLPDVNEVILSLNYKPDRIRERIGNGAETGLPIKYLIEPDPRGTGGAVKFAAPQLSGTTIVFNGDVLANVDLAEALRFHKKRKAQATIVLTPVKDPSQYGVVETDSAGNVIRFLEKPTPDITTCKSINAGIYILEPTTFDRIPSGTAYSIEREYFPSLVEHNDTFIAFHSNGYWLDIGTPATYLQAHRDIMTGLCKAFPFLDASLDKPVIGTNVTIEPGAQLIPPCFIGEGSKIQSGAEIRPMSVIGRSTVVGEDAVIEDAVLWNDVVVESSATVRGAIIGHHCKIGLHSILGPGVVLGDDSIVAPYSTVGTGP